MGDGTSESVACGPRGFLPCYATSNSYRSCRRPSYPLPAILQYVDILVSLPFGGAVRLTITQTASMALRRTQGKSKWTPGRWSTKLKRVNLCTVLQRSPLIYKVLQRGTRDIRSCSSMFFHGSMLSITTRLAISQQYRSNMGLTDISMALTLPSTISKLKGSLKLSAWRRPAPTEIELFQERGATGVSSHRFSIVCCGSMYTYSSWRNCG